MKFFHGEWVCADVLWWQNGGGRQWWQVGVFCPLDLFKVFGQDSGPCGVRLDLSLMLKTKVFRGEAFAILTKFSPEVTAGGVGVVFVGCVDPELAVLGC